MDIDDSQPSPSMAGPSRSRASRAQTSARKPYARSSLVTANTASQQRRGSTADEGIHDGSSGASPHTTGPSPMARSQSTSSGLFSTLSRAISRPLSWLATTPTAPSARTAHPSSSSVAARDDQRSRNREDQLATPTMRSREGQRREPRDLDSSSSSRLARASVGNFGSLYNTHAHAETSRSVPSPDSRTSRRTLHIAHSPSAAASVSGDRSMRSPSPARTTAASAAIRSYGARSRLSLGPGTLPSLPATRRAGSLAPSDSASIAGSASARPRDLPNGTSFTYGFGTERRIGGLTADSLPLRSPLNKASSHSALGRLSPSVTHSHLPSRSPFAAPMALAPSPLARSSSVAPSEGGLDRMSFSPSRVGGSIARSRQFGSLTPSASVLGLSSKQRTWTSLNLAPPTRSRPSDGDELLRDFASSARNLGAGSRAGTPLSVRLGKRDAAEALGLGNLDLDDRASDMASSVNGSARKKQMMWDPEHGFISLDELRALEPPKPAPRNEAERILSVLEGMRTPLGDARKAGSTRTSVPSRLTQTISVPLPTPSREQGGQKSKHAAIGPYSKRRARAGSSKAAAEGEAEGMRAKLKRTRQFAVSQHGAPSSAQAGHAGDDNDEAEEAMNEESEEEQREPTPPRRVTRGMARAKAREEALSPPHAKSSPTKKAASAATRRTTRRRKPSPSREDEMHNDGDDGDGDDAPPRSPQKSRATQPAPEEPAVTASDAVSNPFARKARFQVVSADAQQPRQASSLRQGREKTSRTHGKSGKISAWDSDDDDEGGDPEMDAVDVDALAKIKLPENMFPTGFTFGASSTTASKGNESHSVSQVPAPKASASADPQMSAGEGSLLNRLSGFAAPMAPPASASASASASKPTPAPAASNFFSVPSAGSDKPPAAAAAAAADTSKKSGPVPNFFGSAGRKDDTPVAQPAASTSGFTFGKASEDKSASATAPSSSGFSFGKPSEDKSTPASTGFSFGKPAPADTGSSLGKPAPANTGFTFGKPAESESKPAASGSSAGGFTFGKPVEDKPAPTEAPASSGFSFGSPAPAATSESAKSSSGFSFGKPVSTGTSTGSASSGFSFGQPAASSIPSTKAPESGVPDFFGAKKTSDAAQTPAATSPAPSSSFGGFGASATSKDEPAKAATTSAPPATTPASFTFGAPANGGDTGSAGTTAFGGFKGFGSAASGDDAKEASKKRGVGDDEAVEPAAKKSANIFGSAAPAASSTSGFSFGAKASSPSASASATTPAPFSFGKPAATASSADSAPSKPAFSFGSGASTPTSTPAAGGFTFGSAAPATSTSDAQAKPAPSAGAPGPVFGASSSSSSSSGGWPTAKPRVSDAGMMESESTSANAGAGGFGSGHGTSQGGFTFGPPVSSSADKASPAPSAPSSSTPGPSSGFAFGATQAAPANKPFTFGATPAAGNGFGAPSTSSTGFGSGFGAPSNASTPAPAFGFGQQQQPAPTSAPTGGFGSTNAAGSAPASSSSLSFNFGSGSASGSGASTPTLNTSMAGNPFQFGASALSTNNSTGTGMGFGSSGSGSAPAPGNAPFQFGGASSSTPSAGNGPSATGSPAPFAFGSGGATGTPQSSNGGGGGFGSAPAAAGGNVMFNIGSGGNDGGAGGASGSPAGRTVRRLPNRSRRA
ncbi:unnamed protein product [Parajaminaea phylloscopi]